jgi:hypothetical protein
VVCSHDGYRTDAVADAARLLTMVRPSRPFRCDCGTQVPHAHLCSQRAESIAAIVVDAGPYRHVAPGSMVDVTPTWKAVRTDVQREDRPSCHDLPGVRLGVTCGRLGAGARWMVTAACDARPAISLRFSPDSRNHQKSGGRSASTGHRVVSGAPESAWSTGTRRSQAGRRSPEVPL